MARRPLALVTNDDGIHSPGLVTLAKAAQQADLDVVVAAPSKESSGTSAGLTVLANGDAPIVHRRELADLPGVPCYAVGAHPAFITLAAAHGALDHAPDLVLSGVNRGANIGRALVHSGTVGAAVTAGTNELRAMAVSLDVGHDKDVIPLWDSVFPVLRVAIPLLLDAPEHSVFNVNVPNLPPDQLRELRRAPLASYGAVQSRVDRPSEGQLEVVTTVVQHELEPGTDAALLGEGHPTITALRAVTEVEGVLPDRTPLPTAQ
ncbi:5'/3'-nucleotidase SurE [Goodfellowiella coeruleoviolacea]|uniref:5'-nucleotidase n=1 Tax=Goodfellowiella coeruleoviolacea TaxID=334858 RepID=A0AAE3GLK2_9PSEU|nr:5'/3'-nucleotidase SurE [Goodfellowiella coeruleoviolacea]MCP2168208.1 5'-nucleotidase [Goodfellowiella coeruleoviolacea]